MTSKKTVLIPGSSPISLLYSLLCAKMGLKVILISNFPYGGAWQKSSQFGKDVKIPVSTHILMYSAGLERLLYEIGYKAAPWQKEPLDVEENGEIAGQFGVSHNGLSIGNIGGETDFLEFLTSQVYTQENIIFRNKRIEKISLDKAVDIFCSDGSEIVVMA